MKSLGQLAFGVALALGSGLLVVAAISLSLAEGLSVETMPATLTASPTVTQSSGITPAGGLTPAVTQAATTAATATAENLPTLCPPPSGWVPYTVETGDNLDTLAQRSGATTEQLQQANCLLSTSLLPGTIVYLPPVAIPSATFTITPTVERFATATPCRGAPRGWVTYTVQPNDTLFRLSQNFGVSVGELMAANCMSGTLIRAGTKLYVPNVPTRTPAVTDTPEASETPTDEPSPTPEQTETSTTETPTVEPSPTETPTTEPSPYPAPGEPSLTPTTS